MLDVEIAGQARPEDADYFTARVFRNAAWRLVPLLALCYLVAYVDRINVGFAKLTMMQDLQMSEAAYGLGAGLFFVGYILLEIPSNAILAKVGARIWIARIMITWGVFSGLTMFVTAPWHFYVLRVLLGAAEAGFLPGVMYYLASWFPSYLRGRIIGLFFLGSPLAGVIAGPLSGWILKDLHGVAGLHGWQWLFLLEAIPTVVVGIAVLWLLPNRPDNATWLSPAEREAVKSALAADSSESTTTRHRFMDGLTDRKVLTLGFLDFALLISVYAIFFWMPTFIKNAGVEDVVTIGWLTTLPNVAAVCGLLAIGWSSDRLRERRWHMIVPFVGACAAIVLATFFATNVAATVLLFTVAYGLCFGGFPVLWTIPPNFLKGPAAAAGLALVCSIANISGLISNWLVGWVLTTTGSAADALYVFAGILMLGAVLAFTLPASEVNR